MYFNKFRYKNLLICSQDSYKIIFTVIYFDRDDTNIPMKSGIRTDLVNSACIHLDLEPQFDWVWG